MSWTVHPPAKCRLGKQHKEEQKTKPAMTVCANAATYAAAAATQINPHYQAMLAALADEDNEWWFPPARTWIILLAIMVGPSLDTGQQIMTYLFLTFLPIFILSLLYCAIPASPTSRCYLMAVILRGTPWCLRGTKGAPR
jgi:hypothetical protein